jgi:hypothetical protein
LRSNVTSKKKRSAATVALIVTHQVELKSTQILFGRQMRRTTQEVIELLDAPNIANLGLCCQLAHMHVFEHALVEKTEVYLRLRL